MQSKAASVASAYTVLLELKIPMTVSDVEEIGGHGRRDLSMDKLLIRKFKLLEKYGFKYPSELDQISETVIAIAVDVFCGLYYFR